MNRFLRGFLPTNVLANRSDYDVAATAGRMAIDLAMLGLVSESFSIPSVIAEHSTAGGSLSTAIPYQAQFFYEAINDSPTGIARVGDDELPNAMNTDALSRNLPLVLELEDDEEKHQETVARYIAQVDKKLREKDAKGIFTHREINISVALCALLNLAFQFDLNTEADMIMARITDRIYADYQGEYLAGIRPAWSKYFMSGWFREKLGLPASELEEYAELVRKTTAKRLTSGVLLPWELFEDRSMREMLDELNRNTVEVEGFQDLWFEYGLDMSDDESDFEGSVIDGDRDIDAAVDDPEGEDTKDLEADGAAEGPQAKDTEKNPAASASGQSPGLSRTAAPATILRRPATSKEIAQTESRLGLSLPDDLKAFYLITNGTRHTIDSTGCGLRDSLHTVQSLHCATYAIGCRLELLPYEHLPMEIDWPFLEAGHLEMYDMDMKQTINFLTGEVVADAKRVLEKCFRDADDAQKAILDRLVCHYHGSWEQFRAMETCWFSFIPQVVDGTMVYPDFKAFLSEVVLESRTEEDPSPLKEPAVSEVYSNINPRKAW